MWKNKNQVKQKLKDALLLEMGDNNEATWAMQLKMNRRAGGMGHKPVWQAQGTEFKS
jgi:hypothetical protein